MAPATRRDAEESSEEGEEAELSAAAERVGDGGAPTGTACNPLLVEDFLFLLALLFLALLLLSLLSPPQCSRTASLTASQVDATNECS